MTEMTEQNLSGVAETLLIPLYIRALETQRPDALIKDERAVALLKRLNYDFSQFNKLKMDEDDKVSIILRNRKFDGYARDFLSRYKQAVVVHIGCGLDSRFERVDNGQVIWYDLDLPEVIELRRKLLPGESERYHWLGYSAFDPAWLDVVSVHKPLPFLFMAEGVFQYFKEAQVKSLFLTLRERFPGAEFVCDANSPFAVWVDNLRYSRTKLGAHFYWGLKEGKDVENWGEGIKLLDKWGYFDHPEPRLAHVYWLRYIPIFANISRIYHFRLGKA
jgi:O-methyltransferase involved in polyketide biosynthesis